MSLFQNSVLRLHLKNYHPDKAMEAYAVYHSVFLPKAANIKTSKEEQYQYGFLDDLFVKVLGYKLNPTPDYNLIAEQKNQTDNKKADGAIIKEGKIIAVIELKSTKTKMMESIVNQASNYKNNQPFCRYVITSNFEKLRLYIDYSDRFEEFNLFDLDEERFVLFYSLLSQESLFDDIPLKLKEQSKLQEEKISSELYKKYAQLRANLFNNIIRNNPHYDRHLLLGKTQTILDRMVFIFFAEDRGILPTNTIRAIIDRYRDDIEDRSLYHFYLIYFRAIHKGNRKLDIPEYDGGLFAEDEVLQSLSIDDEVLNKLPLALSAYDFNSDIDVNILGHIFENSLNDIEEMKAKINEDDFDIKHSKRKKDGVFYTPEYITKYIVDNTLGKLCQDKKVELGLDEVEIAIPKNPKKLNKGETKQKEALEAYREYLLGLKILDPACGSGAFLNQALNYLLEEHTFIDEGIRILMGGSVLGLYDVKKDILENNLYGVDINAEAVEIAKLSLWLRTVESGRKLNKLADKIKVGNSLIDMPFEEGSFDAVVGNPPYVRQEMIKEQKSALKERYQTFAGTADLYVYFYELGIKMLKLQGLMGYICSNKYYKSKYGKQLRKFLLENTTIELFTDFGDKKVFHDAIVTSDINIVRKEKPNKYNKLKIVDIDLVCYYDINQSDLNEKSFIFLPKNQLNLKSKIEHSGTVLKEWNIIIKSGIKTGLNEAFVIDETTKNELIKQDINNQEVIKPYLRGRDVKKYDYDFANKWLITTFPVLKLDIDQYPTVKKYLESFGKRLEQSGEKGSRKKTKNKWYEIQDSIAYWKEFEKEKIIWIELSDLGKFALSTQGHFADKTIFFFTGESLRYLLALLNSKLIFWYFNLIYAESGVGTNRWKKTYVEQIPIPKIPKSYQLYNENIEHLLNLKQKKVYDREAKYIIANINGKDLYLSDFLFAKQRGYIEALQGHIEIDENYFRLLPYILTKAERYQNSEDDRLIFSILIDNQKRRMLHIVDGDFIVSIFIIRDKNFQKQLKNKRFKKANPQGGATTSLILGELLPHSVQLGSCQKALWRQADLLYQLYQDLSKKSISQDDFVILVEKILYFKEKTAKYKKYFNKLNAIDKIEISEEIEKLEESIIKNEQEIDTMVYGLYGLNKDEIGLVEGRT